MSSIMCFASASVSVWTVLLPEKLPFGCRPIVAVQSAPVFARLRTLTGVAIVSAWTRLMCCIMSGRTMSMERTPS